MKKLYLAALCFLLSLFLPNLSKADTIEIAGADMSYKWLSGNQYEVQLNIYTKCNYTNLDSVWIRVSSPNTGFTSYQKLAKLEDKGEIKIDCHNHEHWSTCDDPTLSIAGIRKWTAKAEFTLKQSPVCQYIFSWDTCCRTKIISTGAAGNHFYIDAYMRICEDYKVSSPHFETDPFLRAGINYCNRKQNPVANMNDADASYDFEIAAPKQSATTYANFNSIYSFKEPFRLADSTVLPCSPLKIDDSGTVSFRPSMEDVSPLAFNLSKYDKNGVLQNRINRDIIYQLIDLPENRKPIISGINGGNKTSVQYHAGSTFCFTIHSFDVDEDSVFLNVQNLPKGSTFDIGTGKKYQMGTFCWSTKEEDARNEPYIFTVNAFDDRLPCGDFDFQGKNQRQFAVILCPDHDCSTIGIEENISKSIQVYPQPAQNAVYVEMQETRINNLQITDMAGRIFSPNYIWEGNKIKIDLNQFSEGSYILKIATDKTMYNNKLIISK